MAGPMGIGPFVLQFRGKRWESVARFCDLRAALEARDFYRQQRRHEVRVLGPTKRVLKKLVSYEWEEVGR